MWSFFFELKQLYYIQEKRVLCPHTFTICIILWLLSVQYYTFIVMLIIKPHIFHKLASQTLYLWNIVLHAINVHHTINTLLSTWCCLCESVIVSIACSLHCCSLLRSLCSASICEGPLCEAVPRGFAAAGTHSCQMNASHARSTHSRYHVNIISNTEQQCECICTHLQRRRHRADTTRGGLQSRCVNVEHTLVSVFCVSVCDVDVVLGFVVRKRERCDATCASPAGSTTQRWNGWTETERMRAFEWFYLVVCLDKMCDGATHTDDDGANVVASAVWLYGNVERETLACLYIQVETHI